MFRGIGRWLAKGFLCDHCHRDKGLDVTLKMKFQGRYKRFCCLDCLVKWSLPFICQEYQEVDRSE